MLLRLSEDLPVVIEIVDTEEKIKAFMPEVDHLFEAAGCGGMITLEKAEVIRSTHRAKNKPAFLTLKIQLPAEENQNTHLAGFRPVDPRIVCQYLNVERYCRILVRLELYADLSERTHSNFESSVPCLSGSVPRNSPKGKDTSTEGNALGTKSNIDRTPKGFHQLATGVASVKKFFRKISAFGV